MRILYAKLNGYVGIYNGLGKSELEIDFTKSRNRICVISGSNGSGKSTLLNALNVLPDGNECFVPSMQASKQLRICDNDIIYDINIIHPIDNHNNRATTKAYIQKNGIELNTNGNVSSYKDIIFDEFDLDNNYITLSHLSGNDRGLADKKPAERKRFIASISASLDVYNNIHKNLNKKANVYKSYINNLSSKINSIGNESSLNNTLISLNNRQKRLSDEIDKLKSGIVESRTILSINDPNGQLQQKYDTVESELKELEEQSAKAFTFLRNYYESHFDIKKIKLDKAVIESNISEIQSQIDVHTESINTNKSNVIIINNDIQNIVDRINANSVKINKLSENINTELESQVKEYGDKLDFIKDEFDKIGIGNLDDITSSEINQVINILSQFISGIDSLYEAIPSDDLPKLIEIIKSGKSCASILNENNIIISNAKEELYKTQADLDIVNALDNRPSNCKISTCKFIQHPLNVLKEYGDIKTIKDIISKDSQIIDEISKDNANLQVLSSGEAILDKLRTILSSNHAIFSKIGVTIRLCDFESILEAISEGNRFNDLRDIKLLQNASNDIISYKSISKVYSQLLSEQKINQSNINLLNELNSDNDSLNESKSEKQSELDKLLADIEFLNGVINSLNNNKSNFEELYNRYNSWVDLDNQYQSKKKEFEDLQKQFKGTSIILQRISDAQNSINQKQAELDPINEQKKTIDSQILLLESYNKEYQDYSMKFDVIDKLRKYSSPTAGGIQSLFMSLYMNKTLDLANQLLGMIFQGQYRLLEYIINQDEFRMPFIGNGLTVDDISNGSTSQVCIMGMIINLVLLNQASTKYNITRLDEIDGGLDAYNRYMFVDVLNNIINILNIDQLFIISHSVESALSNVDVIQLSPIPEYDNVFTGANIIYTYK